MSEKLPKTAEMVFEEARLSRELDHLYRFAGTIGSNLDVDTMVEDVLDPLKAMAASEKILVALVSPDKNGKNLIKHRGWRSDIEFKPQSVVALGTDAVSYNKPDELSASLSGPLHDAPGPIAMVPLHAYGKHLGLLVVSRSKNRFETSTLKLLNTAGRQLALAVENARLFSDLQTSYQRLMNAQEELIRSERLAALGGLAATMAHEIRNPLATIFSSLSQIRKHSNMTGDSATLLNIAEEEALRLNRMVGGLLEFARPRAPRKEERDLLEVIENTISIATSGEDFPRDINLTLETEQKSFNAVFDPELFERALLHLISNAVAAVDHNTGIITINVLDLKNENVIAIKDNGCGIPPEILGNIFEPFFSTKPSGTGLGLSVVKRIAEDHGGKIKIYSSPGTGTTIELLFSKASSVNKNVNTKEVR